MVCKTTKSYAFFLIFFFCAFYYTSQVAATHESTSADTSIAEKTEDFWTSLSQPFISTGTWLKEGGIEVLTDLVQDNRDIQRTKKELCKNVLGYNELNDEISDILKKLSKDSSIGIPISFWEKMTKSVCQDELRAIPTDSAGVTAYKLLSDEKLVREQFKNKETISLTLPFIKKINTLHNEDISVKTAQWKAKAPYYYDLKNYLNPQSYPWYKKIARWTGYTGVFLLGPYVGNKLYQTLLASYFARPRTTTKEIAQRIELLEEECNKKLAELEGATSKDLKLSLKKSIKALRSSIAQLEKDLITSPKPSTLRKFIGVSTQIGIMALTTYLFYTVFKKIDERYLLPSKINNVGSYEDYTQNHLHQPHENFSTQLECMDDTWPLAEEIAALSFHELSDVMNTPDYQTIHTIYQQEFLRSLKEERTDLIKSNFIADQLQNIINALNNKREDVSYHIAHLKSLLKNKINHSEHLDDAAEHLGRMKSQAITGMIL